MKSRKTWLQVAVRAHQHKTLDHLHRTRQAWDELAAAEQRRDQASQDLTSMSAAWASQRLTAPTGLEIDAVYRRFHGFLSQEEGRARDARQVCSDQLEAATAELKQSHAVQRVLEKLARKKADQLRQHARAAELQANAEAWLLGRMAKCSGVGPAAEAAGEAPLYGSLE